MAYLAKGALASRDMRHEQLHPKRGPIREHVLYTIRKFVLPSLGIRSRSGTFAHDRQFSASKPDKDSTRTAAYTSERQTFTFSIAYRESH
jgi:hypothetical protein